MDARLLLICGSRSSSISSAPWRIRRIAGTRTERIALSLSCSSPCSSRGRRISFRRCCWRASRRQPRCCARRPCDFRWLLLFATVASVIGALLIPTAQRLLSRWVQALGERRSAVELFRRAASPATIAHLRESVAMPKWQNFSWTKSGSPLPMSIVLLNTVAMAIWSVGVFAALYAGYLRPELRATAGQLSAVVNGLATILMFVFIDPYLSLMTDDVAAGKVDEPHFRRSVVWRPEAASKYQCWRRSCSCRPAIWIATVADGCRDDVAFVPGPRSRRELIGDGRPALSVARSRWILSGLFAVFLSVRREFLPHDVRTGHDGLRPVPRGRLSCRWLHVSRSRGFGGTLIAIGVLYSGWSHFHFERVPLGVADDRSERRLGFSFLAISGSYLDAWHGAATLLLLPTFAVGLVASRRHATTRGLPWIRSAEARTAHPLLRVADRSPGDRTGITLAGAVIIFSA